VIAQSGSLLNQVHSELLLHHYSLRTEEAYIQWIKRFILFHSKRHPKVIGAQEITEFLSWLANERDVASSTQNQALSALLFLYRNVLDIDQPWMDDIVRTSGQNVTCW